MSSPTFSNSPQIFHMAFFCVCIRGITCPTRLYTAVHTVAESTVRNSLISKQLALAQKWPFACHYHGNPVCGWNTKIT